MTQLTKLSLAIILLILSTTLYAQKTKMVLRYQDDKTISGYGKLINEKKIRFKTSKKAKAKKMGYEDLKTLESIKYYSGDEIEIYEFVKLKDKKIKLLELMVKGRVTLYKRVRITSGGYMPMGNGGVHIWMGANVMKNYYVKRQDEKVATHLGSNQLFTKSFKKAMSAYVKDCPSLVKKIQNRTYKKKNLIEIVEYYNENCE